MDVTFLIIPDCSVFYSILTNISQQKNMLYVVIGVKECLFVAETRSFYLLLHSESQGYQPQRITQSCKRMVTEHTSGFLFPVR